MSFVLTFRYAYLEYANEEEAYEASEKYKDVELEGEKLYVIKAIAEKKEKYGESVQWNSPWAYGAETAGCQS